jgi:hypothetical protein
MSIGPRFSIVRCAPLLSRAVLEGADEVEDGLRADPHPAAQQHHQCKRHDAPAGLDAERPGLDPAAAEAADAPRDDECCHEQRRADGPRTRPAPSPRPPASPAPRAVRAAASARGAIGAAALASAIDRGCGSARGSPRARGEQRESEQDPERN